MREKFVDFRRGPVSFPCGGTRMAIEAERKDVSGPISLREAHARSEPCLEGSSTFGTGDVADYRRTDHLLQTPDFFAPDRAGLKRCGARSAIIN